MKDIFFNLCPEFFTVSTNGNIIVWGGELMCENILARGDERETSTVAFSHKFCTNNSLPPVCRAFAIISLHLSLMESEVTGARGNVLISVLDATSVASLLWLELLLELLWDQSETTALTSSISMTISACLPERNDQFIPFLFRLWTSLRWRHNRRRLFFPLII